MKLFSINKMKLIRVLIILLAFSQVFLHQNRYDPPSPSQTGIEVLYTTVLGSLFEGTGVKFYGAFCTSDKIHVVPEWRSEEGVTVINPTTFNFEPSSVSFGQVIASSKMVLPNCSNELNSQTKQMQLSQTKSFSVSFTEGITATVSATVKAEAAGIGAEASASLAVNLSSTQQSSTSTTIQITPSVTCAVPAKSFGFLYGTTDSYPNKLTANYGFKGQCGCRFDWFDGSKLNNSDINTIFGSGSHAYWLLGASYILNVGNYLKQKGKNIDLSKFSLGSDGQTVYREIPGTTNSDTLNFNVQTTCETKKMLADDLKRFCKNQTGKKKQKLRFKETNKAAPAKLSAEDAKKVFEKYNIQNLIKAKFDSIKNKIIAKVKALKMIKPKIINLKTIAKIAKPAAAKPKI